MENKRAPTTVKTAGFLKSAAKKGQYPSHDLPEIAFAGRSNVGKSSLINCLLNRKRLVKTSRTPGRTQLINFFSIDDRHCFVDLPGYGFAKTPQKVRESWGMMVQDYLFHRENLRGVLLALDVRREPRREEFDLLRLLAELELAVVLVLTKADKLSKSKRNNRRRIWARELETDEKSLLLFSAKTSLGREGVWDALRAVLENRGGGGAADE